MMENQEFKNYVNSKEKTIKGLTSMFLSSDQRKLLVSSIDHNIFLYKMDSLEIQEPNLFSGHRANYYGESKAKFKLLIS